MYINTRGTKLMDDYTITPTTEIISSREMNEENEKIRQVMHSFIDIIHEEDISKFFIALLQTAEDLQYKLKGTPQQILYNVQTDNG